MASDSDAQYGVTPQKVAVEMTGREFLQAIIDEKLPLAPITRTLPFQIVAVGDGFAAFEGAPDRTLLNPLGAVHGGFAMTLLDSALGCAVQSTLPKGVSYATVETKVNMVRPITRDTGRVRAEGHVIHVGRRTGLAEGALTDRSGKVFAHATSTCLILRESD